MDYNKINKIDVDGNGNFILQDVSGKNITINHNDVDALKELLAGANKSLLVDIQKIVSNNDNSINADVKAMIEAQKAMLEQNKQSQKRTFVLRSVVLTFVGIISIMTFIKANSLENIDIPYYGILFFVVLIPIIISFTIIARNREKRTIKRGAMLMYWIIILMLSALIIVVFTSTFFDYPKSLCDYPFVKCGDKGKVERNKHYAAWQGVWYTKSALLDSQYHCSKINFVNQGDTLLVDNLYEGEQSQILLATLSANGDTCKGIYKNRQTNAELGSFLFIKNGNINFSGFYNCKDSEIENSWIGSRDGKIIKCKSEPNKDKKANKNNKPDPNAFKTQEEICRTKLLDMRAAGNTKALATRVLKKGTNVYLLVDDKIKKIKLSKHKIKILGRYEDVFFFVLPALVLSTDNVLTYSEHKNDEIVIKRRAHARFDDANHDWINALYLTPNSKFKYYGEKKLKIPATEKTFYKLNLWGYVELN